MLGLTVAEIFILLAFLLLFALLLRQILADEATLQTDETPRPVIWERPDTIETLTQAKHELELAEQALSKVENERALVSAAYNKVNRKLDETKKAVIDAERKLGEADEARSNAEAMRDRFSRDLGTLRRKGENPPCWYEEVPDGKGGTREKPYYAFDIAIYEDSVELAPRRIPPGGALDDTDQLYVTEWRELRIDELPYGKRLGNSEFIEAVSEIVAQAKQRQIRTYECVLWVMVWDKTSMDAKQRWKNAHDRLIEGSFGAYTVQDLEWQNHPFSAIKAPTVR